MIYINITNSYVTRRWTGIQRVVREVSLGLRKLRNDIRLIVFSNEGIQAVDGEESFAAFMRAEEIASTTPVSIQEIKPGDILLDMDATWGDQIDYTPVIKKLKNQGMVYVKLHHDAVPLIYPQFCDQNTVYNFANDFQTGLRLADHWICTTRVVQNDLQKLFDKMRYGVVPSTVVPLGSDIKIVAVEHGVQCSNMQALEGKKVILSVGTIEPRKNYELVLDAFEEYCNLPDADPLACLVLVGRSGWNNAAIKHRITHAEGYNQRVFWFSDASDADLSRLYKQAWVCLCLSHYEGFGLPAVEALSHQVPVICIANSAMEEVTAGFSSAVQKEAAAVVGALKPYLSASEPKRIQHYSATKWDQTAKGVNAVLESLSFNDANFEHSPTQAVYISIRPEKVRRSIDSVVAYMRFINECIVLTPDALYSEMNDALTDIGIKVTLLRESEVGLTELPEDHVERNMLLRKVLYSRPEIDSNFIAFDDDYVVIEDVPLSLFLENGKHKAYFFFNDGRTWQGAFPTPTSFDHGVWRTTAYLEESGYSTRIYSAHQPQIINKNIASYIYKKTENLGLDEWSSFFNMASHLSPYRYKLERYITAGWPGDLNAWVGEFAPDNCYFYNDPPREKGRDDYKKVSVQWLSELNYKLSEKSYACEMPSIKIENGISFTSRCIKAKRGSDIKISIISFEKFDVLEYQYLHHKSRFKRENVPAFLYIRIPLDLTEVDEISLKISLEIGLNVVSSDTLKIKIV